MLVILEPAGWFAAWSGLETVFFRAKDKDGDIDFCRKMGKADIIFTEY